MKNVLLKKIALGLAVVCTQAVGALPSWVPSTVGEAGFIPMTNALDDVDLVGVWSGSSPANFTDYSGGCYNPYYGPLGAHIVHGGGHAGTNDNSVFIANFNTLKFERVGGPTQLPSVMAYDTMIMRGGFPDDHTNPREVEFGVPGSAHTYDCLLTLPPSVCGDSMGALIRPVASAIGAEPSRTSGWSHVFTFSDKKWSRWSTNYTPSWTPGGSCAYDTKRGVIWPISEANLNYRSYLTLSTKTFTSTWWSGGGLNAYPDMVYSTYCENRDIVIIATNKDDATNIKMFWFNAASNGSARTPVTFAGGATLPKASWGRGTILYIPEIMKVIYWTQYDIDNYYEIDVPEDPTQPWPFTVKPITGPAKPSTLSPVPSGSTYKRMDYAPQLKSLIWVTAQGANTFRFGGRVVCIRIVPDNGTDAESEIVKSALAVKVSPNPFSNRINVNVEKNSHIAIYNASGKLMLSQSVSQSNVDINTKKLPAGLYFLKATNKNFSVSRKVLKY